jgi:hypothetical protein
VLCLWLSVEGTTPFDGGVLNNDVPDVSKTLAGVEGANGRGFGGVNVAARGLRVNNSEPRAGGLAGPKADLCACGGWVGRESREPAAGGGCPNGGVNTVAG